MVRLAAAAIANGLDGRYSALTMPRKSDTTPEQRAALEKQVLAGEWLRTGDAAKVLGISRSKVDLMIKASALGYRLEPGSRYRQVNPADIKKLLDESRREVRASDRPSTSSHRKTPSARTSRASALDSSSSIGSRVNSPEYDS